MLVKRLARSIFHIKCSKLLRMVLANSNNCGSIIFIITSPLAQQCCSSPKRRGNVHYKFYAGM